AAIPTPPSVGCVTAKYIRLIRISKSFALGLISFDFVFRIFNSCSTSVWITYILSEVSPLLISSLSDLLNFWATAKKGNREKNKAIALIFLYFMNDFVFLFY